MPLLFRLYGARNKGKSYVKFILCPVAVPKICCSLSHRQILTAATPFCSLSRPQDALANVPLRPDLFLFYLICLGANTRGKCSLRIWTPHPSRSACHLLPQEKAFIYNILT